MRFALILLFLCSAAFAREGSGVKGGGMMYCSADGAAFPYDGYYSTDYIQSLEAEPPIAKSSNYRKILRQIADRLGPLNRLSGSLHDSLETFIKNLLNKHVELNPSDSLEPGRVWAPSLLPPVRLREEPLKHIAPHCHGFYQVILRKEENGIITYTYYAPLIQKLEHDPSPFIQLQLSYLFLHEWLRDYLLDVDAIYDANAYLHGLVNQPDSPSDMRERLSRFGMKELPTKPGTIVINDLSIDLIAEEIVTKGHALKSTDLRGYFAWIHQPPDDDGSAPTPTKLSACSAPIDHQVDPAGNPFTDPGCSIKCPLSKVARCLKGHSQFAGGTNWIPWAESSCTCE